MESTVRFTEKNPPAVGKEYNFDSGAKVFKGGDWTKKENWVDPETWSATGARIKGAITGQGRYEPNIPEIGSAPELNRMNMSAMRASMGLLNTRSSDEAKNIISNNIPNAQFRDDANGNTIAIINGQEYYINRPGFSAQDAVQTAYSVLGFLGIGRAFGVGKTGTSIGGNVARSAGTGSALSVAEDVISDASGAQRKGALSSLGLTDDDLGINLPKAVGTGVMTGLFQGAGDTLFSAIPALSNAIRNTQVRMGASDDAIFSNGQLTAQGQQILKQLGVEWNAMTKEFKDRLRNQYVSSSVQPASAREAVRYAEAESLPVRVPQTRGTLSRDQEQQILEDLARKGVYGEEAKQVLNQARQDAESAITSNMSEIQRIIAGSSPLIRRGDSGSVAQAELSAARSAQKQSANQAFKTARDLSEESGTIIPSNVFKGFGDDAQTIIRKEHAIDDLLPVKDFLNKFKQLENKESGVLIRDLFDLRKQINSKIRGGKGDESSVALNKMKTQLDNKIDELLDTAILQGDDIVIKSWRDAIKNYKDYKQKWESGNLIDRLTRMNQQTGNRELVVAPESASNYIFNSSNLGFINKANLQRDLMKMKENLSPDAWNGIRQEVYLKIMNASRNAQREGLSGAKLLTNVNKVLQENKSLMNALYTAEEIALLQQFARVANRTLNTQGNFSNTGAAQMNAVQNMFSNIVAILGIRDQKKYFAMFPFLQRAGQNFRASQAKQSIDAVPALQQQSLGTTPGNIGYQLNQN